VIAAGLSQRRLLSQRLLAPKSKNPSDVVQWLAAVQAQDYAGAKWGLGMRLPGSTDADVERAFAAGEIVRTHVLRPTWHFVAPADIRWLLTLTAPRVHAANAHMYRRLALDALTFRHSHGALVKALQGGQHLTRDELRAVLERRGIATDLERMAYLLMHEELEGVICSGPRRGKQFTYALLDERVPAAKPLGRDAALEELARRFFASRGPATVHDFAKWSGLTVAAAREGLEAASRTLESEVIDTSTYWFGDSQARVRRRSPSAHLMSIYDEYISGYRDRSGIITAAHAARLRRMGNAGIYIVVVNGAIVGHWARTFAQGSVTIAISLYERLGRAEHRALRASAEEFGAFVQMPVHVEAKNG
jgi:hypothetical protein